MTQLSPALLALEDGTLWPGVSCGAGGTTTGEIVFNTSMTGYQEILTDPSYHGQLVTMTQPHIGNTGCVPADDESDRVWAAGFIVRSLSPRYSNWRATQSLPDYLVEREIVAIAEVDTRALVRHIRTHGAMRGALSSEILDPAALIARAHDARSMNGLDLAAEVSCMEPYRWVEAQAWWNPETGGQATVPPEYHVVAYDFGIKRNILRQLAARGCRITVVPANTSAMDVLALAPDGIFLSNGPGDPAAVTYAIDAIRALLGRRPIFGICLGHQLLAIALGGTTYKMKFGHRGGNQPVQVSVHGGVQISSHNHGFAVALDSLPAGVTSTHINLNDGVCEGLIAHDQRAFSVQYHPESAPGPHDSDELFDQFIALMRDR